MYVERKSARAFSQEVLKRGGEGPGIQKAVVPFRAGRGGVVVVFVLRSMGTGAVSGLARVGGEEEKRRRMIAGRREGR